MMAEQQRRLRRKRRGAIVVLAAIALIAVMAFLAFALDWGYIVAAENDLQNAADSAALSGARALSSGRTAAINAAQLWASKNKAAGVPVSQVEVQVGYWVESTAAFVAVPANSTHSVDSVKVTCYRDSSHGNPLNLFIAPIIGRNSANVAATATGRYKPIRCGLIIGLDYVTMSGGSHTNSYNSNNGAYSAGAAGSNGHVCSNGDILMSGSAGIYGDGHPGPGKSVKSSSSVGVTGSTSPLTEKLSYPAADPGDAPTNNNNSAISKSAGGKDPLNDKLEFNLSGGDSVTLAPGIYYFSKLTLSGGSFLTITGATTIYVTGNVDLSGGSVANTTSIPGNLQLYPMGSSCKISGSSEFYGMVYAPGAKVERSGSADFYGSIVGGQLVLSGSGGIHADEALSSSLLDSGGHKAKLVQ
jgi:Flp pilus assembly protein TadG